MLLKQLPDSRGPLLNLLLEVLIIFLGNMKVNRLSNELKVNIYDKPKTYSKRRQNLSESSQSSTWTPLQTYTQTCNTFMRMSTLMDNWSGYCFVASALLILSYAVLSFRLVLGMMVRWHLVIWDFRGFICGSSALFKRWYKFWKILCDALYGLFHKRDWVPSRQPTGCSCQKCSVNIPQSRVKSKFLITKTQS